MNFRDFLKLNEEKATICNTDLFKLPTLIKGEQGVNASRNSLRRMHLNKQMIKKVKEVLKCIKTFCLKYIKGDERALVLRIRDQNTDTLTALSLTYNNNDIRKIAKYIIKGVNAETFLADYEEPNSNGKWFYEFMIKDFKNNKTFLRCFPNSNLSTITERNLYIKFSFRYVFDLNRFANPRCKEKTNTLCKEI